MPVQYGVLSRNGNQLSFRFRNKQVLQTVALQPFKDILDLLDRMGQDGWELCAEVNVYGPINSLSELVFIRRL